MKKHGRRIYFNKVDGSVIVDTGEKITIGENSSIEDDVLIYNKLKEIDKEFLGVLELEYGDYIQDFNECEYYSVDIDKKTLKFKYKENIGAIENPEVLPISQDIKNIKEEQALIKQAVDDILLNSF